MSTIAFQGLGLLSRDMRPGVSEEAHTLKERIDTVLRSMFQSVTLGKPLEILEEVYEESSQDNWDGYGASAVGVDTYLESQRFLQLLPTTIPFPEITVEPDGEIAFEWFAGPGRVLSISVGSENILTYAGLFGINKTHGTEYFGDVLPVTIVSNLQRLFA